MSNAIYYRAVDVLSHLQMQEGNRESVSIAVMGTCPIGSTFTVYHDKNNKIKTHKMKSTKCPLICLVFADNLLAEHLIQLTPTQEQMMGLGPYRSKMTK